MNNRCTWIEKYNSKKYNLLVLNKSYECNILKNIISYCI